MKKGIVIIIIFIMVINFTACASKKSDSIDAINDWTDEIIEISKIDIDEGLEEDILEEDIEQEEEDVIVQDYLTINSEEHAVLTQWWEGDWYGYWEIGYRDSAYGYRRRPF